MRKFLFLFFAAAVLSCNKDKNAPAIGAAGNSSIENAKLISSGKLVFTDEKTNGGIAKIYLKKNDEYMFGLEEMNYKPLFKTNVYLSPTPGLSPLSIKLLSTQDFCISIYSTIPSGVNIAGFKYMIIQGSTDSGPAATATLE